MRNLNVAVIVLLLGLAVTPAAAEGEPFVVRFGAIMLNPTSSTTINEGLPSQVRVELDRGFGGELDFEWYFLEEFGLEGSVFAGVDSDIQEDKSSVGSVTMSAATIGVNWHIFREPKFDWYLGVVGGMMFYGDAEPNDGSPKVEIEDQGMYGAQTAIDFGIGSAGRWGINVGLKWLRTDAELKNSGVKIRMDPFILRLMGVFRF